MKHSKTVHYKLGEFTFTKRQKDVIEKLAESLTQAGIAAALRISVATVKSICGKIYDITSMHDRAQIMVLAKTNKFITIKPEKGPGKKH